MRLIRNALIGGVLIHLSMFLIVLPGVILNVDRFAPGLSHLIVGGFFLTHPASNYLIPEGEARSNYGSLVVEGLLVDTLLYCAIVLLVLILVRAVKANAGRPLPS
ncbi:MAG TPA: hypothetical protein VE961_21825 [Pyrinomonadaceae bacterium]|nr:hypothetical protein [Pyrinomonadaceae bacterium]